MQFTVKTSRARQILSVFYLIVVNFRPVLIINGIMVCLCRRFTRIIWGQTQLKVTNKNEYLDNCLFIFILFNCLHFTVNYQNVLRRSSLRESVYTLKLRHLLKTVLVLIRCNTKSGPDNKISVKVPRFVFIHLIEPNW